MNRSDKKTSTIVLLGCLAVSFTFMLFSSQPAQSLTGADIVDKMNDDEGGGYVAGSVGMAAFLSGLEGNRTRSQCILDWYYEDGGVSQLFQALDHFKSRQAQPVIHALIKKQCGE